MKDEILIRKAKLSDLPNIFKMWKKLIAHHRRKKSVYGKYKKNADSIYKKFIRRQIHSKYAQVFVAELNSKLVAHALFIVSKFPPVFLVDRELGLGEIFVEEKFRKKGIAQRLMKEGQKWGKKKGLKYANLEVHAWNEDALNAYKKAGFRIRMYVMKNY